MKLTLILILALLSFLFGSVAHAQYPVAVVADPIAQIDHAQDIAKWIQSIQDLNTQIQQFQQQIQIAQQVEGYIGNPVQAAEAMGLPLLDAQQLTQSVGQLTSTLDQTVNGAVALENSGSQLFSSVSNLSPAGFVVNFDPSHFTPFAAIQNQEANIKNVIQQTASQIQALEQQKASTLLQIKSAPDQSTVQKLMAQASAFDGQIAALGQQQQTSTDQMVTQNISNQNDKAMKAQAANESADHEMNVSVQNFMQWQGQVTGSTTDFQ